MEIIDLSTPMEVNKGEPAKFKMQQIGHREGAQQFSENVCKDQYLLRSADLQNEEFLNLDIITASTHTGTHIDAPFHYGSQYNGKRLATIDELPLEWFWGNGVILDFTKKKCGTSISKSDILDAEKQIQYKIQKDDVILIRTGADQYWGTEKYFDHFPGLDRTGVEEIVARGVHLIGTDAYSLDRPFSNMLKDFQTYQNASYLFPAHFFGREKPYCQVERLANLDRLKPFGFYVACFPIKITGAGAAWTRAVAIYI